MKINNNSKSNNNNYKIISVSNNKPIEHISIVRMEHVPITIEEKNNIVETENRVLEVDPKVIIFIIL